MHRFTLAMLLCALPSVCRAIVVTNPDLASTSEVDRYANSPSFLQAASASGNYDLTGVGQSGACIGGAGTCRWATMISATNFVSATHSHPTTGEQVSFRDDDGTVIATHTVSGGVALEGTDLWLGELSTPIDTSAVAIYDIAAPITNHYLGSSVVQVGVGGNIPQFRVGQNQLNEIIFSEPGVVNASIFGVYYDNSAAGGVGSQAGQALNTAADPLLPYETYFQGGDSGAPTFVDSADGNLSVLGVHSFISEFSTDDDPSNYERRGSADVYLPHYYSQLNAKIQSAAVIPEPSAFFLLLAAGIATIISQRSRKQSGVVRTAVEAASN